MIRALLAWLTVGAPWSAPPMAGRHRAGAIRHHPATSGRSAWPRPDIRQHPADPHGPVRVEPWPVVRVGVSVYALIDEAVEYAVSAGIRRAYKHRDDALPPDAVQALEREVHSEVMSAICEHLDFPSPPS